MNILFIGYGSIAKKHKLAIDQLYPSAVCVALRSGRDAAEIEGVRSIFAWDELTVKPDFAIVSTPTFRHTEDVKILVEKNIPVFLEKPVSHILDGLDELTAEIKQQQLATYVACNLRFLPVLQFLHDYLNKKEQRVNEVLVYAGSYLPSWRPGIDYKENYSAKAEMGGGVHLDLFHELDYISWLFGQPEQSFNIRTNQSSLNLSAIDFASYSWMYKGFTATILLNYFRRKAKRTIEIVFDESTWIVDLLKNNITTDTGELIFEGGDEGIKGTYLSQMKYFTDNIKTKTNPVLNTFEDSVNILKVCLE